MSRADRLRTALVGLYALAAVAAAAAGIRASLHWVGSTFPGFFLMSNRVVPSLALTHWTGMVEPPIFQRQVLALDETRVQSAAEVYDRVAAAPAGRAWRYTMSTEGDLSVRTIPSMVFTWRDYVELFGPLLLNGTLFLAIGMAVWVLGQRSPATVGTAVFTLDVGFFCLTALDLYWPGTWFRLHAASEALFPATLLHLLLVFPVTRLGVWRRRVIGAIYLVALVTIALYEGFLYAPATYTLIHNGCMAAVGIVGAAMIVSCIHAYVTSTSLLVRRRLGIVMLGILAGFTAPAWVMLSSAFVGGERGLNLAVFTAFLFPLSLAYAVVKHDLFEIDALLRRGLSYLALTSAVAAIYGLLGLASGVLLRSADLERSPVFPLIFTLLIAFLFHPMRVRIQHVVDRLYARSGYDPRAALEQASTQLVATLDLDDITELVLTTIQRTMLIADGFLWLRDGDRFTVVRSLSGAGQVTLAENHPLPERLRRATRGVSVHEFEPSFASDPAARACKRTLTLLGADLVLPIGGEDLLGFVMLGPRPSGRAFTVEDVTFLSTFINQVAVAIRNAQAYREIEELNVNLEQRVAERTTELATANGNLAATVRALEEAYKGLERSQETLAYNERMATLGKLAAGIAHEVNTPLGAVLNALKIVRKLADEYTSSIGDPEVRDDDHRALADDLVIQIDNIHQWTTMAAAYVRTIRSHTPVTDDVRERMFDLPKLLDDIHLLLTHRLRLSGCRLVITCPADLTLYGDAGKLGQVVTNLVTNAIDAYEGAPADPSSIRIRAVRTAEGVDITVEDEGCGIAPEHIPRIFEALFTTKAPGKGTGLGLSLSRDIVRTCFGGEIAVVSTLGMGSRFTLRLPTRRPKNPRHFDETPRHAAASA